MAKKKTYINDNPPPVRPPPTVEVLESYEQRQKLGKEIEAHLPAAGKWCDEMGFDCVSHAIEEYGLGDDKAAARMVERDIQEWADRQARKYNRSGYHDPEFSDDFEYEIFGGDDY